MRLSGRQRSIKDKLLITFIIAALPIIYVQIKWHASDLDVMTNILAKKQADKSVYAAAIVKAHAAKMCDNHYSIANSLANGTRSSRNLKTINKTLRRMDGHDIWFDTRLEKPFISPLLPGHAGLPTVKASSKAAIELSSPIVFKDGSGAFLISKYPVEQFVSDLPGKLPNDSGYALLGSNGRMIWCSDKLSAITKQFTLSNEQIQRAFAGQAIADNRIVQKKEYSFSAAKVPGLGLIILLAEPDISPLAEENWILRQMIALGFTVFVIMLFGNKITYHLRRLSLTASAIAVGDYRRRINIRSKDEFETIANSFNTLGENLLGYEKEVKKHVDLLSAMADAIRMCSTSLSLRECGNAIAQAMCVYLDAKDAAVFRINPKDGSMKIIGRKGRHIKSSWKLLASHVVESADYLTTNECVAVGPFQEDVQDALLVGIPIGSGSEVLGAIVATFYEDISKEDLRMSSLRADLMCAFGIHSAAAIRNSEIYAQTKYMAAKLQDSVKNLSSVVQMTDEISQSLTLDDTLEALARSTTSMLNVDACAIFQLDKTNTLVVNGLWGLDPNYMAWLKIKPGEMETGKAFQQKKSVVCQDTLANDDANIRAFYDFTGIRSILSTPLFAEDSVLGAITTYSRSPNRFTHHDANLLESVSRHVAFIVRNATLYSREFSISETFQNNIWPEIPNELEGLKFAGKYIPLLDDAKVGGDFYEVTLLPNGKVGVLIADVSGKGLNAARYLAACKYMIKALMHSKPDEPAAVLNDLNKAINYYYELSFFVTMFYGVIDPLAGSVTYASAGHLPGLLISPSKMIHTQLDVTGAPIGSGHDHDYREQTVSVDKSDTLLLFTDGVIEASRHGKQIGIDGLHNMIFEAGNCSYSELIEYICRHLANDADTSTHDDIALLAISFENIPYSRCGAIGGTNGHKYHF